MGDAARVTAWSAFGAAQEPANRTQPPSPESVQERVSDSVRELREQVRELQAAVAGMRSDWQRARAETAELRRELNEIRTGEVRSGTGLRNAVLTNAMAKAGTVISGAAAGSLPSVLQDGAQDQRQDQSAEDQKGDQKKREHAASIEEEYQLLSEKWTISTRRRWKARRSTGYGCQALF